MSNRFLKTFSDAFVTLFAIIFAIKFFSLANGNLINNYPYISPDGFDWYLEGAYLVKILGGAQNLQALPVLRPPMFVLVTMADYLLGANGLVLALTTGLGIFFTYYLTVKITNILLGEKTFLNWYVVAIAFGITVYPLNFIRPYVLADTLAIALALASVFTLFEWQRNFRNYSVLIPIIIASLAGLTQTYAILPFLISCGVGAVLNFGRNKKSSAYHLIAIFSASFIFLTLSYCWRIFIPHVNTPENFTLLRLSGAMLPFYLRTWSFYFFPIIVFFIIARKYLITLEIKDPSFISIGVIVIIFSALCFFYQWPEARFTYYLWPWILILFFSILRQTSKKMTGLFIFLVSALIFLSPDNYWDPNWRTVNLTVDKNWIAKFLTASSVDRGLVGCNESCLDKNNFLISSDGYVNSTVRLYLQIGNK